MDLYVRRGMPSADNPEVVQLSELLNAIRGQGDVSDAERYRNPNGVHMKLGNFRTQERPGQGLQHGNQLEPIVWERFSDRRDLLAAEVNRIKAQVAQGGGIPFTKDGQGEALIGFLKPFKPKADLDYEVQVEGGIRTQERSHETLVNSFAEWLSERGLKPSRNVAIDLGIEDPPVIIEAKQVNSWPLAIRQAVGQLYEYRYFKVAAPNSALIFLSSLPVPAEWVDYLEKDRHIAVAWKASEGFFLTDNAKTALRLAPSPAKSSRS